ncbi:uncharacterized protein RJT20DRAFT_1438 [Scheffersomyces xylosifermentans]|uniref:uncharacterized protein n=1 Tax=Scheffersomyces xylosifermentans TaxID=1304137 RepID=UPI00315DFAE9
MSLNWLTGIILRPWTNAAPSLLNLRVGKIIHVQQHENADKLYVSQIQIEKAGEGSETVPTVQVCSGLVQFIPLEQMKNRRVVVLTNLKPSKMRGVKSEAMLLATEKTTSIDSGQETKVELINPPITAEIGEKLHFHGFPSDSEPPRLKSKIWEEIQSHLRTNGKGEAAYFSEEGSEHVLRGNSPSDPARSDTLTNTVIR